MLLRSGFFSISFVSENLIVVLIQMIFMKIMLVVFLSFISVSIFAQATVGVISAKPSKLSDGYNLFYPHNQSTVFLMDNCGRVVHSWTDEAQFRPGNWVNLQANGNLIKGKRNVSVTQDPIWAGGGGAIIETLDWDNKLINRFERNDSFFRVHHDFAVMPNGNILIILWDAKYGSDAINEGRDTSLFKNKVVWSEAIVEWDPIKDSIVWEWYLWDHVIQDYDSTKKNHGFPEMHPELVDLNFDEETQGQADWLHMNAIDYNPVLDQIVMSIPHFNELWIIDHSTSTAEAKTHKGGRSGKGGDLLYRWGNPKTYGSGNESDQKFFFQHDVHWQNPLAQPGASDFGRIVIFNNRTPGPLSPVVILNTGITVGGQYEMSGGKYLPADFEKIYSHPTQNQKAKSPNLSSSQFLPNGNILICAGNWGYIYEMTPDNEIVWEYITPIRTGTVVSQGDTLTMSQNITFRFARYPKNYSAFTGKDLKPGDYIELNPDPKICDLLTSNKDLLINSGFEIFPNPASQWIEIRANKENKNERVYLYDISGVLVFSGKLDNDDIKIDVSKLTNGLYFLLIPGKGHQSLIINR